MPFVWSPGSPPPEIEEHSLAKLSVLRDYLPSYIDKLCVGSPRDEFKLDLIDGFSGGGLFLKNGVEVSGTPLIMLEEAEASHRRLNKRRVKPLRFDFKFHFVDVKREHTLYLETVLFERRYDIPEHSVAVHTKAFEDVADEIISDVNRRQPRAGRAIFLLDQTGFSQVPFGLIRKILDRLANAEVILTFAVETLINHLADHPNLVTAVEPIELSHDLLRDLIDMKESAGGKALVQRVFRDHLRARTGATFDTPFFIRPKQSRRALWFVHLSRHPVARDVMIQCHWNNFNTFEHHGSGGLDMMGWDPLKSGLPPLFGFSEFDAQLMHQELLETLPSRLPSFGLDLPVPVNELRTALANHTAARFSDLDKVLLTLAEENYFDILNSEGKVRQRRLTHLSGTDLIALSSRPMFPGWSRL